MCEAPCGTRAKRAAARECHVMLWNIVLGAAIATRHQLIGVKFNSLPAAIDNIEDFVVRRALHVGDEEEASDFSGDFESVAAKNRMHDIPIKTKVANNTQEPVDFNKVLMPCVADHVIKLLRHLPATCVEDGLDFFFELVHLANPG